MSDKKINQKKKRQIRIPRSHNPRTSCSLGVFDLQSNMAAARFCCAGEV